MNETQSKANPSSLDGQHTPGPWASEVPPSSLLTCRWIKGPDNQSVALVGYRDYTAGSQAADLANARLIAAAPDMLNALELVASLLHDGGDEQVLPSDVAQYVRAAIAKAMQS